MNGTSDGGERNEATTNTVRPEQNRQLPWPHPEREAERTPSAATGAAPAAREGTAAEAARIVVAGRWTVLALLAAAVAAAAAWLAATSPTYESSILIQVEGRSRPVTAFEDLAALFQEATPTEGEMRILRSRTLLEPVVADLKLDVEARPRAFPIVGAFAARRYKGTEPAAPPWPALARWGWGGERMTLGRLQVSEGLEGQELTLTALEGGRYRVAASDGTLLAEGEVGQPATGTDGDRSVELLVTEITARPGTEFVVVKRRPSDVVEELQRTLRIAEQGRATGLVEVDLTGEDPALVASTLDAMSATYRRQSVERTSAEAAKTLGVLEAQLPVLKEKLEKAERALNAFQSANGAVNLPLEGEGMLQRLVELDRAIGEGEGMETEQSRRRYTDQFPEAQVLESRTQRLREQRAAIESRLRTLPTLEMQSARLQRQVRVATELYLLVLNRAEELRIVKSGWIGNVRVLERAAVPHRPVSPKPALTLALAAVLGLGAGIALVLARGGAGRRARDPEEIEIGVGLPVYAAIPRSGAERRLERSRRHRTVPVLAAAAPEDPAVEDLRGLRTAVQFALRHARNNVVAVTGLAPRAGKSFVSMNLAHLLAAAEGRVVVVDGDLRRGTLHRLLGVKVAPGLADVLAGAADLDAVVRPSGTPHLDVIPAGTALANAGELLAGDRLERLLAELGTRYRAVVVDTPPVLAVADAALIGRHAGVNLVVLRAGEHTVPEVVAALRRLAQGGVLVRGAILNGARPASRRAAGSRRYHASYTAPRAGAGTGMGTGTAAGSGTPTGSGPKTTGTGPDSFH